MTAASEVDVICSCTGREIIKHLSSCESHFYHSLMPQLATCNTIIATLNGTVCSVGNVNVTALFSSPFQILTDEAPTPNNVTAFQYRQECSPNGDCETEG